MGTQKLERSRLTFMEKMVTKDQKTRDGYRTALNNFENFCMERFGKADYITELKEYDNESIFDFLQLWINWNNERSASTVLVMFSSIKKYLHHRGIKLHPQDIKEELEFRRKIEEELYGLSLDNIQTILGLMRYKHRTQFVCQQSSLMRIGELVQLRKKHLVLGGLNIIVKIPANIAKFKKGRTTFFSKEATKLLRPILRQKEDNDLIFGSSENSLHSEINVEQILRRILDKSGLDMRYESNNRYMINTHSFRAYGITKLSRHDPNFAKKIAGQKGYLLQYDRMTDEEKLEIYEKHEVDLIIDDSQRKQLELDKVKEEKFDLEKANSILQQTIKEKEEIGRKLREASTKPIDDEAIRKMIEEVLKKRKNNLQY